MDFHINCFHINDSTLYVLLSLLLLLIPSIFYSRGHIIKYNITVKYFLVSGGGSTCDCSNDVTIIIVLVLVAVFAIAVGIVGIIFSFIATKKYK